MEITGKLNYVVVNENREDIVDYTINLIDQGYNYLAPCISSTRIDEMNLYVDEEKKEIFFTDSETLQSCRKILNDLFKKELIETNLKELNYVN